MHTTQALLDAAKVRRGLDTDYKLAKALGVAPNYIANYRKGRSRPDDTIAQRLAALAGLDPDYVVACMHAERAATDDGRLTWERIAKRLQATAVAVAAVILSGWTGIDPVAGAQAASVHQRVALDASPAVANLYIVAHALRRASSNLMRAARHALGAFFTLASVTSRSTVAA